jgi:twitching motility two-component system response regulator PilH
MTQKKDTTIMIVDDDAFLLDMYALKFTQNHFTVVPALGTPQALEKLQAGDKPDIMLLDIVMPVMDGLEFLEKVKKDKLVEDTMIIMLSNLGQDTDIERAIKLGADGYIIKASATPSEVVTKVQEIMDKKG